MQLMRDSWQVQIMPVATHLPYWNAYEYLIHHQSGISHSHRACSPFSFKQMCFSWCLFSDPHRTIHHSNISAHVIVYVKRRHQIHDLACC